MSQPEVAQDDDDRHREREQPRNRVHEEENSLDDGDPDGDPEAPLAKPPPLRRLAMLDYSAGFKHAPTLASRGCQPGLSSTGQRVTCGRGSRVIGEQPEDDRPGSCDI